MKLYEKTTRDGVNFYRPNQRLAKADVERWSRRTTRRFLDQIVADIGSAPTITSLSSYSNGRNVLVVKNSAEAEILKNCLHERAGTVAGRIAGAYAAGGFFAGEGIGVSLLYEAARRWQTINPAGKAPNYPLEIGLLTGSFFGFFIGLALAETAFGYIYNKKENYANAVKNIDIQSGVLL
jgi:ribosomal protein L21E